MTKQKYVAVDKTGQALDTGTKFKLANKYPRSYYKDVEIITIEEYKQRKIKK